MILTSDAGATAKSENKARCDSNGSSYCFHFDLVINGFTSELLVTKVFNYFVVDYTRQYGDHPTVGH